jgi:hypothetical protein
MQKIKTPYVAMTRALVENAKQRVPRLRDLSDVALRNFLTDQEAIGVLIEKYRNSAANGWKFPLLSECREAWEKRYGPTKWDTNINDWGDEEEEQPPFKEKVKPAEVIEPKPANANIALSPKAGFRRF